MVTSHKSLRYDLLTDNVLLPEFDNNKFAPFIFTYIHLLVFQMTGGIIQFPAWMITSLTTSIKLGRRHVG